MPGIRLDSIPETAPVRLSDIPETRSDVADNLSKIDQREAANTFEEPSTFSYLFNRLKKGVAGFMGAPGDVVRLAQSKAGNVLSPIPSLVFPEAADKVTAALQTEKPLVATSEQYRDVMGVDPNMRTKSDLKRYAGGVAEMAGAGGPFAVATKPAAMFPLLTSTVGSGIGMEAGGDVASGLGLSRDAGEMAGALAGGVATAVSPNVIASGANVLKNRLSPSAQRARAESQVSKEIGAQLESYPPAAGNLERSLQISEEIPGFTPSLPARANAPGLLAEERQLVSQNPKTLNRAVENIESNNRAIADFVDTKFPASAPFEAAADKVNRLVKLKGEALTKLQTQVDEKMDDAVRVFEANPSNYENGNRLRDLFFKQKAVYSGIRSQKYNEVYEAADRLGVKANIDDAAQYAKGVLESELNAYQASEIPPVFRQLAKKGEGEVSFAELHSLYKRTNSDLASLRGSSSADKDFKVHLLEDLKSVLANKINGFEAEGFGEVAAKLKEANRFYRDEYLPRFKQGFGGDVAARYSSGEFRTPDQLVTELITKKPNNTQAAKDFKMLFAEVPEAWESLRAGYLDELYRNAGAIDKNGQLNQRALDTFLRKHEPTLAEFPQIKGELKQLATDNQALLDRRAQIVAAEKKLAAKDLYRLFQGRDPDAMLAAATSDKNAMRVIAFQARNDPNAANGLARGIAEYVTKQPDPAAFLAANEDAIRIGLKPLGEEHFKNLQTAVEAMTINARNAPPASIQAGAGMPDSVAEKLGSSPRAIISHILNIERGRTGVTQEGFAFLGRWFDKLRRDHKAIAMEGVFYDKDAAAALARLAKNPKSEKAQLDFATQMTALGVRAEVAGQP